MKKRFLPSFEIAPGPNRSLVRDPTGVDQIRFGVRNPDRYSLHDAHADLIKKRHLAGQFSKQGVDFRATPECPPASDWPQLRRGMRDWLHTHLQHVTVPAGSKYELSHVLKVAEEGVATSIAFLEVIPKVLFRHDFASPNADIASLARSSVGFVIEWAGLDDTAEYELAWALATPKPRKVEEVFDDLQFNPRWFAADDQRISLDNQKVGNLRDSQNQPPQRHDDPRRALFACPAAAFIPRMHYALVNQAEAGGLFEQTYVEERANHGYQDAWEALGNLTLR